jgi:hypothetical protein
MTERNTKEPPRQTLLVTDPEKTWVLTSTSPGEEPVSRAISGLSIKPIESGGLEITPLDLGTHNIRTYLVYDYAKSTNNNTGKITFSSRGTKFEVRALTLEDADWLFPGREFLSLRQLNEATLEN